MLHELSNQLADVVATASASVVQVHGRRHPASGLVYADEVVLTTGRAIGREDGLHVRPHEGDALPAELAGWDPATGLAVLRVPSLRAPAFVPAGEEPKVGHLTLAVGRSWSNAVTASAGIVAIIGGPLPTGRHRRIETVIRTTAPMHDGFAGGALLSVTGGLIGIATAATIRGLGVVIPARIAWSTAAALLEHGSVKRGYLGIVGQRVTLPDAQRAAGGGERALLVAGVSPDGPAARAGVLVGDIVAAVEGTPVESPQDLLDVLSARAPGQTVTLRIVRARDPLEIAVTLGDRPER